MKAHGKSAKDSYLLNGYALNTGRAAQGMPTRVTPARIACLDFNLQKTKMQLGVQVLVTDPRELEKIRQRYLHSVFGYFRICLPVSGRISTVNTQYLYLLSCYLFLICSTRSLQLFNFLAQNSLIHSILISNGNRYYLLFLSENLT